MLPFLASSFPLLPLLVPPPPPPDPQPIPPKEHRIHDPTILKLSHLLILPSIDPKLVLKLGLDNHMRGRLSEVLQHLLIQNSWVAP